MNRVIYLGGAGKYFMLQVTGPFDQGRCGSSALKVYSRTFALSESVFDDTDLPCANDLSADLDLEKCGTSKLIICWLEAGLWVWLLPILCLQSPMRVY